MASITPRFSLRLRFKKLGEAIRGSVGTAGDGVDGSLPAVQEFDPTVQRDDGGSVGGYAVNVDIAAAFMANWNAEEQRHGCEDADDSEGLELSSRPPSPPGSPLTPLPSDDEDDPPGLALDNNLGSTQPSPQPPSTEPPFAQPSSAQPPSADCETTLPTADPSEHTLNSDERHRKAHKKHKKQLRRQAAAKALYPSLEPPPRRSVGRVHREIHQKQINYDAKQLKIARGGFIGTRSTSTSKRNDSVRKLHAMGFRLIPWDGR
jgi:hypothetical protein